MAWPVGGLLSSLFGRRDGKPHQGIDLSVPQGSAVRAACDGVVVYAGHGLRGYGNLVILAHADQLMTVYAHNYKLLVQVGQKVARNSVIALSGKTGHVTAPHLHFEVRQRSRAEDPLRFLVAPPKERP